MEHQAPSSPWPDLIVLQHCSMTPHCEAIAQVIAWLEAWSEQLKWPPRAVLALTLCVDEALTNIVSHAKAPEGEALQIQLLFGTLPNGCALCVADNGAVFDPTAREPAELAGSLEETEAGGHGLRLMRHYLQRFEYRRQGERNWLLLGVEEQKA